MSASEESISVLYVDDDPQLAALVATYLEHEDERFTIETAASAAHGLDRLATADFDCIVSDFDMPEQNGIDFLKSVRDDYPDLPFILFTGKGSEEVASEAIAAGVTDYLQKQSGTEQYELLAHRIDSAVIEHKTRTFQDVAKHDPLQLLERISDGFLALDTEWRFTYVNQHAQEIFDTPASELLGEKIWDVFPEAKETAFYEHYHRALADGEPRTLEEYFEPWDRWYREHIYPSEDGLSVLSLDITEHKKQERRLQRLTEQYETILKNTQEAIFLLDVEDGDTFRISQLNPSEEALLEQPPADVTGKTVYDLYDTETADKATAAYQRCLEAGEPITSVETYRLDGRDRTFETNLAPIFSDGEVTQIVGVSREITEAIEREESLRRFQTVVDQAGTAVYITDPDGVIQYVNRAFEELTGYSSNEAIGETPTILNADEHDETYFQELWETVRSGAVWEEVITDQRQSGEKYKAVQTIAPITDDHETITGYVAIQNEITDRLLDQQRLSVLNRILRHNIRNDLSVIQGQVEFVMDAVADEAAQSALQTVLDRCERLLRETEKARELQQLLDREQHEKQAIGTVITALREEAARMSGGSVELNCEIDTDRTVLAVVERALIELLQNAIEHVDDEQPVKVEIKSHSENQLEIAISDRGPGLPEMEQRVLDGEIEEPLNHSQGLGLWSAYWLIQIAGGSISFEKNEQTGSTITVRVPLGETEV